MTLKFFLTVFFPVSSTVLLESKLLTCPTYSCSLRPLSNNECIHHVNNSYTLYPCTNPSTPYCPWNSTNDTTVCTMAPLNNTTPDFSYIGESCGSYLPCSTGKCVSSVCHGDAVNSLCVNSSSCDAGLRCYEGVCVRLLEEGEWGCRDDFDCDVRTGCNFLEGRFNGTCMRYYSQGAGAVVTQCTDQRSNFCQSTYCIVNTEKLFPIFYCIDAPMSLSPSPIQCQQDADCGGLSRPWTFTGNCTCGYNEIGTAYCYPFLGDGPGLAILNTFQAILNSAGATCHTDRRLMPDCLKVLNATLFTQLTLQQLYFAHYPQLQNNDQCVKYIYTSYYWMNFRPFGVAIVLISLVFM